MLLFREPFTDGFADDPTLAPINLRGNLVELSNEVIRKLGSDYPSIVGRLSPIISNTYNTHQSSMVVGLRLPSDRAKPHP